MVKSILTAAGVKFRKTRFLSPPTGSYVVYFDDVETDGPDGLPRIYKHDYTVELYEHTPDDAIENAIEIAIAEAGLQYTKQDRYWLQDEQLYQVIYNFNFIEKRR